MELTKAKMLKGRYDALLSARSVWDARFQQVAEWIKPYEAEITDKNDPPTTTYRSKIHDIRGIKAADTLINGHTSYVTPFNEIWMNYSPQRKLKDNDKAKAYYKECSEITMDELAASNFYPVINLFYSDRTVFGTAAMMSFAGKNTPISFLHVPIGTYCYERDKEGRVTSFYRECTYTLDQAVAEFGEDNLGTTLKAAWEKAKTNPAGRSERYKFLHVVLERNERDPDSKARRDMPYTDDYVCLTDECLVNEDEEGGGFESMPYMVSKYKGWGADNDLWGLSPAIQALPSVLSANYGKKLMKTIGETAALPRILRLAGSKGQVDYRAGGVTFVTDKEARSGFPKEWGTSGRFDIGLNLVEMDHKDIDDFFHVPLFLMFAQIEKQMTATEVASREREKLLMFTPSFNQLVFDMSPMMVRIFSILSGLEDMFPEPPADTFEEVANGELTDVIVPDPSVVYQSKIALAIKALQAEGFDRILARLMGLMEIAPEMLDHIDFDTVIRDMFRNENAPEAWLKAKEDVEKMRAERAAAQQQQEQMQQMQQMAQASGQADMGALQQGAEMVEGMQ